MPGDILMSLRGNSAPPTFAFGNDCIAVTARGNQVRGWIARADAKDPKNARGYWCHGRTLGTHARYGYSVFGDFVLTVLQDEYEAIEGGLKGKKAGAGTVALFRKAGETVHTCLIVNIGGRTTASVHVWTKNGAEPDQVCLLNKVIADYPHCLVSYWCERPSAGSSSSSSSSSSHHGAGGTDSKSP